MTINFFFSNIVSMEYVDIVNENDEVVGKVTKQEAHEKGLLHRTVISEVIGSDTRWTLVKQSSKRQDAGQYVSPIGGHVEAGETEEEALTREAFEEYGLNGDLNFRLVGKKIFNREILGRKENHYFILFEIKTDDEPLLNDESDEYERFTEKELAKQLKENPRKFGDAFHFVVKSFYPKLLKNVDLTFDSVDSNQ